TRATPSRAAASTQRRSRGEFPAVPRRIRPRTPRLAQRRSRLRAGLADPRRGRPEVLRPRCCLTPTTVGELRRTDAADQPKRNQDGAVLAGWARLLGSPAGPAALCWPPGPPGRPLGLPITWDRSSEGTQSEVVNVQPQPPAAPLRLPAPGPVVRPAQRWRPRRRA